MISFVCWKWSTPGYRSTFGPEAVNTLARMVRRHYDAPHRFLVVTNDRAGINGEIEIVPDRADFAEVRSPHGSGSPSCYRRLRLFAPDAARTFGERIVSLDLDAVIVGDLRSLVDRPEDFVAWSDPLRPAQYNASFLLLTAGARPRVWTEFDPQRSPREARAAGWIGSDQAWLTHCLGPGEARWSRPDGVYSYRVDKLDRGLPADARIVFAHGDQDPWGERMQGVAWVREHYR